MSGLLRRLTRRGPATAEESRPPTAGSSETAAAPADAPAEPGSDRPVPADEQQTRVLSATDDQAAPAEEQPAAEPDSPGARWATGTTDEPAAKEATKELDAPGAPTDAEAKSATTDQTPATGPQRLPVRDLPAGLDPGELTSAPPGSARRGKLRRRLRYLRHVRELLLRDLGGFTYEIHRTASGTLQEGHRKLAEAKANRIAALDAEVGDIEARLGVAHAETLLREPGIGGTCPECGELYASDARFCARCGLPLDAKARAMREASVAAAAQPTPEPQPASVLWAGGPRPAAGREAEEKAQESEVTSRWLLGRDQPTTADRAAQPDKPAGPDEPGADKPATADEPAAGAAETPAPAHEAGVSEQPAATNEPDAPEKPSETNEPGLVEKPSGTNEPEVSEQPAATNEPDVPEKPSGTNAPAATDQPDADDASGTAPDEPSSGPTDDPPERRFEPGPNGRRDDDVRSPLPDPLTSRPGEQGP